MNIHTNPIAIPIKVVIVAKPAAFSLILEAYIS